jgi:DNA (cytosine-5)-methyltransferase 1
MDKFLNFNGMNKKDLFIQCELLEIVNYKLKTKSELIQLIKNTFSNDSEDESESGSDDEDDNNDEDDNINPQPTFIEVCAGCGGLSTGLINAGFKPLLLNDNNKDCCSTLKKNHPENTNIVLGSMEDIQFSEYIGKVDLLTGGVPCQSFSHAGLRKGLNDDRGNLMLQFIKIINLIKPKVFMIENVKGLLSHDNGNTMKKIMETIKEIGLYNVVYECLNAFLYNVPQKRERVFIVGTLKTLSSSFVFPKQSDNKIILKNVLHNVPQSIGAKYPEEKIKLFKMISQGSCWIELPKNMQKEYLGNSYNSGGGKRGILYRLSMEKPSLTLLCTPSQKQTERCHPLEERPLTIREYARIQTFDDNYEFIGSMSSQYKQIGNAVPVILATQLGKSIINVIKPNNKNETKNIFNINSYYKRMDKSICSILTKSRKETLTYDILDTEEIVKNKLLVLKEKQRQMKIGEIWQEVLGNYEGFINLNQGHESGLDIISKTKHIAIELKNRTNTDNHSSKKSNLDKLAKFKKKYPNYTCVYANINDNTKNKTLSGSLTTFNHNGVELQQQIGYKFLTFILQNNTDEIIDFVKKTISKYS